MEEDNNYSLYINDFYKLMMPTPLHITPKSYGEYLMQSGRWKRNRLANKIAAKRNRQHKHR